VWWALGCLKMAAQWRSGADRMLERVVISRRTSEQELDLLLLLEEDAPEVERQKYADPILEVHLGCGEATNGNIATAISEWLETIKPHLSGHDRFQLAVARNALGMIARDDAIQPQGSMERPEAQAILVGESTLASPGLLRHLRATAIEKLSADVPKYPALAHARKKWTGEN